MSFSRAAETGDSRFGNVLASFAPVRRDTQTGDTGFDLTGVVAHCPAGRQIYAEGDDARSFYKVIGGTVRTCRFLNDGRRQIAAFHGAGDVFGIESGPDHRLTAEAVTDCSIAAYRWRGLDTTIVGDDRLGHWFLSHLMAALSRTREHGLLLGRGSAAQKIAAFLLEQDALNDAGSMIDLPMTRQDIADYLGLTIETVSRTLSQLERDRVIDLPCARRIGLKDRQALRGLIA